MPLTRALCVLVLSAVLLALTAAAALVPATAAAVRIYQEGQDRAHPFTVTALPAAVSGGPAADPALSLARTSLTVFDARSPIWRGMAKPPNPRDVYPLAGGHVLIADKENLFVAELDASGAPVWKYSNEDGAGFKRPFSAQPAVFAGRRCVLIAERLQYRVFAVSWDNAKEIVWQYGTNGVYGLGVNQLMDPFAAVQLPNGNVLVSDENSGNRVIEISATDYDPTAPDLGYTDDSIVWQYGTPGVAGVGVNQIIQPRWPQRLANGPGVADDTTLFTDANGHRVIEVRDADFKPGATDLGYRPGSLVWTYGTPGAAGRLTDPNRATRIVEGPMKGTTVVADTGAGRILWVSPGGQVTDSLDTDALEPPAEYVTNGSDPRAAIYGPDRSLWIPDPGYHRLIRVGYEPAVAVTWRPIDCGEPERQKVFLRLTLQGATMDGSVRLGDLDLQYRTNADGPWKTGRLSGGRVCDFPKGTAGRSLTLRITLRSADRWHTPVLDRFILQYDSAKTGPTGGGGGGTDSSGKASTGTDDATYTFPGVSGTGTGGGGTGSGSSGYGSGSGTTGTGSGGATTGAPAHSAGGLAAAPPPSSAVGRDQSVTGVEVQGLEGVSGLALKAAPGAHVAEDQPGGGGGVSLATVAVLSLCTLAGLLIPWPVLASDIRHIGGFDHTRRRRVVRARGVR